MEAVSASVPEDELGNRNPPNIVIARFDRATQ
jgi:hypothetical protein